MAAAILHGIGATTPLSSVNYNSSRRSLPGSGISERKRASFGIQCYGSLSSGSNIGINRAAKLSTNAVATKQDNVTASTPSKPGYFLFFSFIANLVSVYRPITDKYAAIFYLDEDLKGIICTLPFLPKKKFIANIPVVWHELLLFEALREGLEEEMERDPRVCVIGEDVGHYGGSYKVTKGLADKYGDLRVLDTPIAENSFTGMGIGAAMTGLRPIVEGMNMGFLLLAFNQISNNCGMLHYTSGGQFKIPIVIRGPGGVGRQLGAEHSQRLESYFQSIPGIQMVACSTPYNAKGLMKAAIRSDNPVILFEHVLLYNLKERIPDEEYVLSLEEAEMVRKGEHVTILTYSRMRYHVMQAAKTLVNKGYDPEVIDIRSLKPFDLHTIGNSVKKTNRVVIVEECMRTGGIGASLTASINEHFHDYLDAPIVCLSSQDVPTPYAGTLEDWTVVQPGQIVAAVEQLCQ
ncbi:hypothetical protein SASPL_132596 [Salvia splendens]|uniref:pyruvate dehydrogenase (acetyl-transferring) n=1 Tax=Salvia splendens TaxID=180675 RepID=A0A8X8ZHC0_SALSN|nr:hypothetical protein SASPL_132596 [Salvia splendens]